MCFVMHYYLYKRFIFKYNNFFLFFPLFLSFAWLIIIGRSAPTSSAVRSRLYDRSCHERSEPFKNEMPLSILPSDRACRDVDGICTDFARNSFILELELVAATTAFLARMIADLEVPSLWYQWSLLGFMLWLCLWYSENIIIKEIFRSVHHWNLLRRISSKYLTRLYIYLKIINIKEKGLYITQFYNTF